MAFYRCLILLEKFHKHLNNMNNIGYCLISNGIILFIQSQLSGNYGHIWAQNFLPEKGAFSERLFAHTGVFSKV